MTSRNYCILGQNYDTKIWNSCDINLTSQNYDKLNYDSNDTSWNYYTRIVDILSHNFNFLSEFWYKSQNYDLVYHFSI